MKFRKLRIAWSVFWGVAAVLLIVLWVRSNHKDVFYHTANHLLLTNHGYITLGDTSGPTPNQAFFCVEFPPDKDNPTPTFEMFAFYNPQQFKLSYVVAVAATMAIVPWLFPRFSLRTLLIATTLVAVVLGLIVWLSG
jgi:hypothetical protein